MATNCSPSTSKTTGGASAPKPVWNRHSSSPVLASSARKLPSGSPRNTTPPAVTVAPPARRYGVLCCQTILFVLLSIAVNVPLIGEPGGGASPPPPYALPGTYSLPPLRQLALARTVPDT